MIVSYTSIKCRGGNPQHSFLVLSKCYQSSNMYYTVPGGHMVQIEIVVQILVGIVVLGGGVITFFVMQKEQNMKIKALETALNKLEKKLSKSTEHQIETEKFIAEINVKLEHITKAIDKLIDSKS